MRSEKPMTPCRNTFLLLLPGLLFLSLQGCGKVPQGSEQTNMETINTEVTYRERILMPPGSVLRVSMEDVSLMDVASTLVAEALVEDPGAPPYRVALSYDPAKIDNRHRYAVRATIRRDDKLLMTSTTHIDALAPDENGLIRIRMESIPARAPAQTAAVSLASTRWQLVPAEDASAAPGEGVRVPFLQLTEADGRASGFSGCNRYSGSYTRAGESQLRFGQMASTRMACPGRMEQEQRYLAMLSTVRAYDIDDRLLTLLDEQGNELARFTPGGEDTASD